MSNVRLYVSNFPYDTEHTDLQNLFWPHVISNIRICTDQETGQSRGFGFVELAENEAEDAIKTLNGTQFGGRTVKIALAKPKPDGSKGRNHGERGHGNRERRNQRR